MTLSAENERVAQEFAHHGLRATRQRIAVLHLLRAARNHPTVREIHRGLTSKHPRVSRKTVYEIVDSLVRAGLAAVVTDGGEPYRYEGNTEPHCHARCRICDRLFDLPSGANSRLRGSNALPEGFHVEAISVTYRGVCGRCRNQI